jgi:predicted flap endonuclease-1-like 5' DNA nuclease
MIEEVMMPRLTPLALVTSAACAFVLLSGCGTAPGPLQSHAKTLATSTLSAASARAYPVEDLLGVGPTYGEKLRKSGVKDTSALLTATDNSYRRHKLADDTGIPYPIVLRLSQSVELMKIDGVGVREANLLQAIGVESVAELAQRDVKNLIGWARPTPSNPTLSITRRRSTWWRAGSARPLCFGRRLPRRRRCRALQRVKGP